MITKSMLQHLGIFLVVEIVFVLLVFRELPVVSFYGLMGILHLTYWGLVVVAGWLRERSSIVRHRFLCTYVPVVYHLLIHLGAGVAAFEMHHDHHDEHSLTWMIISVILLGGLIWAGEWYLHRVLHCKTHHASAHAHCQDDCEREHSE